MSLTLGLLSGASPAAALKFLSDVQAYTPAGADRGHLRVIADINPRAVGREIPGLGASAGGALAEAAGALRGAGAEMLAIVSNSAHAWGDMIQRASGAGAQARDLAPDSAGIDVGDHAQVPTIRPGGGVGLDVRQELQGGGGADAGQQAESEVHAAS